ncbi:universal stress protein [Colwellia sp. E2M01]|uniref:universal stress protein n=1 Tax=Colwellia sp. E2M01 TaxID=2841561 RepID=UPI001C08EE43|nr:universal stress protein [Colwellia sp. E2M01]MBU2871917.1 universal stress protein [Colwellia sp. E2M01]
MISEQLIWFIDGRYFYKNITLDKIVQLANSHNKHLKIIIDVKVRATDRWYWHSMVDKSLTSLEGLNSIEKKKQNLLSALQMSAIKADIITTESSDHVNIINAEIEKSTNNLVIIEDAPLKLRHAIFQRLTEIDAPVLLLSKKVWTKPIKIIGAVDPLHEHDKHAKIDEHIVEHLKYWAQTLTVKWQVVHACYISSVLYEYQHKVQKMHQSALTDFAKKLAIKAEQYILLDGLPEDVISTFINKQHIDVLCIGLVNRNKLNTFWVGSTTTHFLSEPPCDLLLIKR